MTPESAPSPCRMSFWQPAAAQLSQAHLVGRRGGAVRGRMVCRGCAGPDAGAHPCFWLRGESVLFGLLFAASSLILTVQAYQESVFDRYLLAPFIGLLIVVAIAAEPEPTPMMQRRKPAPQLARLVGVSARLGSPLLWFSVAGVHDYFRWNDARWALVRALLHRGSRRRSSRAATK